MGREIKRILKDWLPPPFLRIIQMRGRPRWSGNYGSWAEAKRSSTGYNSELILEKVKAALLQVKNGKAVYERDSVLFEEPQYSWPLLASLMWIAARSKGVLNIIDFGGSLGSSYFQNRMFLQSLTRVQWNIVEQKSYVDVGKEYFEGRDLEFFHDIESCLRKHSSNTILFSSVLQYLEKPYLLLEKVKTFDIEFILLDRTSFNIEGGDRLTIQTVPPEIYPASYPCWFFDKKRFCTFFEDSFNIVAQFESLDKANIPSTFEGYIFQKKQGIEK